METILARLAERMAQFEPVPSLFPATHAEIASVQQSSITRLDSALPSGYLRLLVTTNGFIWNGLTVFAATARRLPIEREVWLPSIVEENEGLRLDRPEYADYLVFAQNDLDHFVWCISDLVFLAVSLVGGDVFGTFPDFESLITSAIERVL
jgi:hypothetical protein